MPAAAPRTLLDVLAGRALDHTGRPAFVYQGEAWTYGELWRRIGGFGARLLDLGLEFGDRVVLALPNGPEFFTAFYGVQRAGGVPAPLHPGSGADRLRDIASSAGAEIMVIATDRAEAVQQQVATRICTVPRFTPPASDAPVYSPHTGFPNVGGDDLCFIQYTSGSTGDPKGVQLSHANIMANLRQLIAGMRITRRDVFVS